jgi:hypothetical protein
MYDRKLANFNTGLASKPGVIFFQIWNFNVQIQVNKPYIKLTVFIHI